MSFGLVVRPSRLRTGRNSTWSSRTRRRQPITPASNSYVVAAGTANVTCTVIALTAGNASNVAEGIISVLSAPIPGIDTVTNGAPFENGDDSETDANYRVRFPQYLASLSKCTPVAVKTAITSVQQDVTSTLVENLNYAGATQRGYFYAVVDDGSGDPPSGFLSQVANSIEATRPIATSYGLFAPVQVNAAVVMTIVAAAGYTHATVAPLVQAAIQQYINSLPMGVTLEFTKLFDVAWGVQGVGVIPLAGATLNGGTTDLVPTAQQVIKYTSVTIN
jgi:uncharacterized phage protein gp47/JayE